MYVSIVGGGSCSKEIYRLSVKLGQEIAKLGAILITGGLGGVMEAVAKGAKKEGGTTIGIIPSESKTNGNRYTDYVFVTGMGQARNILVVLNGDVVVAINGKYGTLSEIGLALKYGKKVIGLRCWHIPDIKNYDSVEEVINEIKNFA
jgi:uncharacterized protein (TIGR00725 family)